MAGLPEKVSLDMGYRSNSIAIGAEIWEGDERRKFQFLESGDSLKGRNLFTELPFLQNSLPMPSFTECLDPIQ